MALFRENKKDDIDTALERFAADAAQLADASGVEPEDPDIKKKERKEKERYLLAIDKMITEEEAKMNSGLEVGAGKRIALNRDFLQRYQIEKLVKPGGFFNQWPTGPGSYAEKDLDLILLKTLAIEGPEFEKPGIVRDISGYIANVSEDGELDKSDVFTCTRQGKEPGGKIGKLLEGMILTSDGIKVKAVKIVKALDGADGGVGSYKLSTSLLVNSQESPGNNFNGETPPTLIKRYNALSFAAAKKVFDVEKKSGGLVGSKTVNKAGEDKSLGLSSEQAFEVRVAFDIVAEEYKPGSTRNAGGATIPAEKVFDVFLAIGHTMMNSDIDLMLSGAIPGADGNFTCDDLIDAFDTWKQRQLSYDNLKIAFNALVCTQKLPRQFDSLKQHAMKIPGDACLPSETLRNALNDALHLDGDKRLRLHEIKHVEDEISSNAQNHITFLDFVEIFTS